MADVGFLYNCSLRTNPGIRISPSLLNRVALIETCLRDFGHRLLFFSPKQLRHDTRTVLGYRFDGGRFVPASAPVPAVNGNWTYQTRRLLEKGMGYQSFVRWTEERDIGIYVPLAFSELVGNKYETYALVRGYHEALHPHCEPYRRSLRQLRHFTDCGRLTFVKPTAGNKGDGIVAVRRKRRGFVVSRYAKGRHERQTAATLKAADRRVREALPREDRYLIQQGVDALRYRESVFDIRVIMLYDGRKWDWLHEARLSASGKDLSNVSQGGSSVDTEALLFEVLGAESSQLMLGKLKSESHGLAVYLERLHPGDLMEIAFDFVIDAEGRLHLLEINTKPGLINIGFETSVYDRRPEDTPLFERWVVPHAQSLARFMESKLAQH